MKKSSCPSCGASYNGKHCRACGYERFTEEIAHRNHTHKGEPLVIDSPARKPVPRKNPFDCEKKSRKKRPFLGFLVLLLVINSLLPLIRTFGLELKARETAVRTSAVQPEPILQPENMVMFHQEGGITIFTTPEQFADPNDFCLYVHNESPMAVTASAGDIQVNGIALPHATLVCKARSGEIGKGWLEPDVREWEAAGIRQIQSLSFTLTILAQDGRILFSTDEIHLAAEASQELIF